MRIGFSAEAALVITDSQGIYCIEEINILADGEIKNICNVIRRPGGVSPITNVANLGIQVFSRAKNNLKLARFFLKHKASTGRVAVATDITLDNMRILCELKEREKERKDHMVSPVIDAKNWPNPWRVWRSTLGGILELKG